MLLQNNKHPIESKQYRAGLTAFYSLLAFLYLFLPPISYAATVPAGDVAPRGAPDGTVNIADFLILTQFVTGSLTPTAEELMRADVAPQGAPDGVLDVADLLVLQRAIFGDITLAPITIPPLIPLPPPPVIIPLSGSAPVIATATSVIGNQPYVVSGTALPGAFLHLYVNGILQAVATANAVDGSFSIEASLINGSNIIYVTAWDGAVESSPSAAVDITRSTVAKTIWYRNPNGPVQPVQAVLTSAQVGIGYGNKIVVFDNHSNVWKFENGYWAQMVNNSVSNVFLNGYGDAPLNATPSGVFLTTNGSLLLSYLSGNAIFRSTDNGATWARVLNFYSGVNTTNRFEQICQADNGWIFAGQYHMKSPTNKDVHLWRSKDDGVTWEDLATKPVYSPAGAWLGAVKDRVAAHIHAAMWDKWRKHLYVAHGDSNTLDNVFVSDDYGETFYEISTIQIVGMVATPRSVFLTGDYSGNTDFFKLDVSSAITARDVAALTPTVSMDQTLPPLNKPNHASIGYSWIGYYDGKNVIFSSTSGVTMATSDDGATWLNMIDYGTNAQTAQSEISDYNTTGDGYFYWKPGNANLFQMRAYTDSQVITYESHMSAADVQSLINTTMAGMNASREYLPWDTTSDLYTPGINEGFEGTLALTILKHSAATVAANANDSHAGTRSGEAIVAPGQWGYFRKSGLNYSADGSIVTMECWVKTNANMNSGSILEMVGSGTQINVALQAQKPTILIKIPNEPTRLLTQNIVPTLDTAVAFPSAAWHYLRWDTKLHPTAGWTKLAMDGKIVMESVGLPTLKSSSNITELRWGINAPDQTITAHFDDCKAGMTPAPN